MILRHADAGSRPIAVLRNQHRAGVRHRCEPLSAAITLVYARAFVVYLGALPTVQPPISPKYSDPFVRSSPMPPRTSIRSATSCLNADTHPNRFVVVGDEALKGVAPQPSRGCVVCSYRAASVNSGNSLAFYAKARTAQLPFRI
jgi:hypothetical protein